MTVELITGHAGSAHISSADDGWRFAGTYGDGSYVLDTGTKLACSVVSATLCTIGTGDAIFEGRHIRVSTTTNVPIDNGAQGVNRNDIICLVYEFDTSTEVESAYLEVVKGTAGSTATDPTIPSGNILEGSEKAYMPLWRIPIEGLSIGTPVKLYGDVLVTLNGMLSKVWSAEQIPSISAAKITSGTLAAARIPNLDAAKITTGTFAAARIPALDAAKITTGTLSADRIPGLAASKITSGTLADARIPGLAASKITSGAFDTARIPNLPASKITSGILAKAQGGTGNANGTADSLTTARTIRTNLASTSTASFNGTANVTPGVTGTLPTSNGGTGKTGGECLMAYPLYGNATGATGNITLTFPTGITKNTVKRIDIIYRDNDYTEGCATMYGGAADSGIAIFGNSETATLTTTVYVSGMMWIKSRRVQYNNGQIINSPITSGGTYAGYVGISSSGNEAGGTNQIYITRVIGYC